tara:strand:+ start:1346 stop:1747 length:402 start_codon:yes stop_codon:yes gene_type:complete
MSFNFVGQAPLEGDTSERYFYALRRDDDGQLFIAKVDKASPTDVIQINRPGGVDGNYTEFQAGESFFEGRNPNHVLVFDNLVFEQMRWDDQNIYYYINDEGEVVLRVNTRYTYPEGTASDHLPFGTNATGYAG